MRSFVFLTLAFGLAIAVLLPAAETKAQRAASGPPDWPCVQRLVPEIGWGTIWAGPPLDQLEQAWWEDEEVGRIVRFATARETSEGEAVERVRAFAESLEPDEREERLTLLFSGLHERINRERSRTIESIRRFSRSQVSRLEDLSELVDELETLRDADAVRAETVERLEKELHWEQRTFQMRQQSLPALCEQPYLLEEKLSRMVRAIQAEM